MQTILITDTLYTTNGHFAGYAWSDGILGDQSPAEYAANSTGHTDEQNATELANWLAEFVDRGEDWWLTEAEAAEACSEVPASSVYSGTPLEMHLAILKMAEAE